MMHIDRSHTEVLWFYNININSGATVSIPVGGPQAGFSPGPAVADLAPVFGLPYFSIDVYTDRAVAVWIETIQTTPNIGIFATLTCAAVLRHNTIYDLPAPHNKDGYLVITAQWLRLRVQNLTGANTTTFELLARAWR